MGDEIYISHEMKTPGMLDIELLKYLWESIFSSALTHINLKQHFFLFLFSFLTKRHLGPAWAHVGILYCNVVCI